MALADYRLCDVCSKKTFYDANIDYNDNGKPDRVGDWLVICNECAKKFKVQVVPKEQGEDALTAAEEREKALVEALEFVMKYERLGCVSYGMCRAALAKIKDQQNADR